MRPWTVTHNLRLALSCSIPCKLTSSRTASQAFRSRITTTPLPPGRGLFQTFRTMASSALSLNNKIFQSSSNTANGEVTSATRFHYHQQDKLVWAEYGGGTIVKGFLIATVKDDGSLDARYEHVNSSGDLMTGQCRTELEQLEDGRIKLNEKWQWTSGDRSRGESTVEEVKDS